LLNFDLVGETKDWYIEYLKECGKQRILPLAEIATKGMKSEYHLFNYQMSEGLALALTKSLASTITEEKLQSLALVDNGLIDYQISEILDSAFGGRHPLKSISISKNEFGPLTTGKLIDLFLDEEKCQKVLPIEYALEELRISLCKTSINSINNLLKVFASRNTHQLKTLILS